VKKHTVKLTQEQRERLQQLINTGQASARKLTHARILLKADEGEAGPDWSDAQIKQALEVGLTTIWRVRKRFHEEGLDEALNRQPQPERPETRIIDGEVEAHLIALICAGKPEEQDHWSLRLLAEKLVQLGEVEHVSHETVRQTLKKTNSNPGSRSNGVFHQRRMLILWLTWKTSWRSTSVPMTSAIHKSVWMRQVSNY
jgi:hypothetical protein